MDDITMIPREGAAVPTERWSVLSSDGREMTGAVLTTRQTRFADGWVDSLMLGGVGTDPEYRRRGHVRRIIERAFSQAKARGWAVSILHPFSFSYYRKFGYERVADHLVLDFPLRALDFLPRCDAVEPVRDESAARAAMDVMNAFSRGRGLMPRRVETRFYPLDGALESGRTYLHRGPDGAPDGYVTLKLDKTFRVNTFVESVLTVRELCFLSPEALRALLGFLRMFDGEAEAVHVDNCAMAPELDVTLRHYMHTTYRVLPDLMARVLDVEALLRANAYPDAPGAFTLRVEDPYGVASGAWSVRYGGGRADIEVLPAGAPCGLTMDVTPLAPLLYGAWDMDAHRLRYVEGVRAESSAEDFLRAFPVRPRGIFEHF